MTPPGEAPARRSRWQRFSPSMGWPAFWSEILIVVLGVVIALAANEAVEEWNWQRKVADAEVRLRGYEVESRRLSGQLLVMRDPIALDPAVRADLLTRINDLRSIYTFETLNARQRMRLIADAGLAPPDAVVERFLNLDGKHPSGADFSGTAHWCTSKRLPLGNWRDFDRISVNLGAPGQGDAR